MDAQEFSQLGQNLKINVGIQPQIERSMKEQLEILQKNCEEIMKDVSIAIILLQVFSSLGLKYLWNIMNLLQFLIYMRMWQIKLPPFTETIVKELKSLAFMDFIPKEKIQGHLKGTIGLEDDKKDFQEVEKGPGEQEIGIDRIGSKSLIDNMGIFLLIAIFILLIFLLLGLFYLIQRCCPNRLHKCYQFVKKKLLYNSLLRFVLQSTLKI